MRAVDMMGRRCGKLTVVARHPAGTGGAWWVCRCDCGGTKIAPGRQLNAGRPKSCGCLAAERARSRAIDMVGRRFGLLTVTSAAADKRDADGRVLIMWRCVCDCGGSKTVRGAVLRSGNCQSCGCQRRERCRARLLTHGMRSTPEYGIWAGMRERCRNPNTKRYEDYGGRGIRVCAAWRDSFPAFLADVGRRPSDGHSINRVDNDGNYSCGHCAECVAMGWPANVQWATRAEQARNKRSVPQIAAGGRIMCLTDWAAALGLNSRTLSALLRSGYTVDGLLSIQPSPSNPL